MRRQRVQVLGRVLRRAHAAGAAAPNTSTTAATGGEKAARPAGVSRPRRAVAAAESVQGAYEPTGGEAVRAHDPDAGRGPEGASLFRWRRGVSDLGRRASCYSAEEARASAEEAFVVLRRAAAVARRAPAILSMLSCTTVFDASVDRIVSYGVHSAAGAERY